MHRLATIDDVTEYRRRQTDATL